MQNARQSGAETFQADYRVVGGRHEVIWVHNLATRFVDKQGDTGYIHFLTDITHERALLEQLKSHLEQERLFDIVSRHSNRILYAYDLATRTTRSWNTGGGAADELSHLYIGTSTDETGVRGNSSIMLESVQDTVKFFEDIHSGVPTGDLNIRIRMKDGEPRWYHFKYSTLFEEEKPVTALISVEDITERHEHELAYLRHVQAVEDNAANYLVYAECCLSSCRIEKLSGTLFTEEEADSEYSLEQFHRLLSSKKFTIEYSASPSILGTSGDLLSLYENGMKRLEDDFSARFADGSYRWLRMEIVMMPDPFNGYIKAFIHILDVTDKKENYLSVRKQAEEDAITGLLRRDAGDRLIREHLAAHTAPGGILIVLDLDDLKGINDHLGHQHGDKAIKGIADTLKNPFRKGDILVRAGGDEFMVFLPDAAAGISSVKLSLASLLQKLSLIPIGENDERTIHCSIGCAVELPDTDTFDSLFQRADIALYHVKRNGKNSFSFFDPEMLEENYRFKVKKVLPVTTDLAKSHELQNLLEVVAMQYPGVVMFNLTPNFFTILSTGSDVDTIHVPDHLREGLIKSARTDCEENLRQKKAHFCRNTLRISRKCNVFMAQIFRKPSMTHLISASLEDWSKNIHPDDRDTTISTLSRGNLLFRYAYGQRRLTHYFRNKETVGYSRTEVDVRLFSDANGDVSAFLFFRQDTGEDKDLEIQRLNRLLDMSGIQNFEYVCLVNVKDRSYSTFASSGENSHVVPENTDFDTVTQHVCDTQIPPEQREAYLKQAMLDRALEKLEQNTEKGVYAFRYTLLDDITREAVFSWYGENHVELLMTVRKI